MHKKVVFGKKSTEKFVIPEACYVKPVFFWLLSIIDTDFYANGDNKLILGLLKSCKPNYLIFEDFGLTLFPLQADDKIINRHG